MVLGPAGGMLYVTASHPFQTTHAAAHDKILAAEDINYTFCLIGHETCTCLNTFSFHACTIGEIRDAFDSQDDTEFKINEMASADIPNVGLPSYPFPSNGVQYHLKHAKLQISGDDRMHTSWQPSQKAIRDAPITAILFKEAKLRSASLVEAEASLNVLA